MAGAFAPNFDPQIAQEQPVGAVEDRTGEILVKGITNLFSRTGGSGGSSSTSDDYQSTLNANFLRGIDEVVSMRDEGREAEARMLLNKLETNFKGAGGQLSGDMKQMVERRAGVTFEDMLSDPMQDARNAAKAHPAYQGLFMAAARSGLSEDQAVSRAIREVQGLMIDEAELSRAEQEDTNWWKTRGRPAAERQIEFVASQTAHVLAQAVLEGDGLNSEMTTQLLAALGTERGQMMRNLPQYLSQEDKDDFIKLYDDLVAQATALDKIAASDTTLQVLRNTLKTAVGEGQDMGEAVRNLLAGIEEGSIQLDIITGGSLQNAGRMLEAMFEATHSANKVHIDPDFMRDLASEEFGIGTTKGIGGTSLPPRIREEFDKYQPPNLDSALTDSEAMMKLSRAVTLQEVSTRDGAISFGNGVFAMSAALDHINTNDAMIDPARLQALFGNPEEFAAKMEALAEHHPQIYAQVSDGLSGVLVGMLKTIDTVYSTASSEMGVEWSEERGEFILPNMMESFYTPSGPQSRPASATGNPGMENLENARRLKPIIERFAAASSLPIQLETTNAPELVEGTDRPVTRESVFTDAIDAFESTDAPDKYDTLFGFSNRDGRPFEDIRITEMTVQELIEFSAPGGEYAQYARGELGYVATPMGRYQFVGDTLKDIVNRMGLPPNTVFTRKTQDAMFAWYMADSLKGVKTTDAKVERLRGRWEGFKKMSRRQLAGIIEKYEGFGDSESYYPVDVRSASPAGDDIVVTTLDPTPGEITPTPQPVFTAPEQPAQLTEDSSLEGSKIDGEVSRIRPTGLERTLKDQPSVEGNEDVAAFVSALTGPDRAWAETQGVGMDAPIFKDQASLERAIADGTLQTGDKVLVADGKELVAVEIDANQGRGPKRVSKSDLSDAQRRSIQSQLSAMGVAKADWDVPVFDDVDQAMDAILEGTVQMGDVIVIGGYVRVIEDQSDKIEALGVKSGGN